MTEYWWMLGMTPYLFNSRCVRIALIDNHISKKTKKKTMPLLFVLKTCLQKKKVRILSVLNMRLNMGLVSDRNWVIRSDSRFPPLLYARPTRGTVRTRVNLLFVVRYDIDRYTSRIISKYGSQSTGKYWPELKTLNSTFSNFCGCYSTSCCWPEAESIFLATSLAGSLYISMRQWHKWAKDTET